MLNKKGYEMPSLVETMFISTGLISRPIQTICASFQDEEALMPVARVDRFDHPRTEADSGYNQSDRRVQHWLDVPEYQLLCPQLSKWAIKRSVPLSAIQ